MAALLIPTMKLFRRASIFCLVKELHSQET